MHFRVFSRRAMVLLALACAVPACNSRYIPVSVSGIVTLEGKPVEGATVQFYAVGDGREGRPATGSTDGKGNFRLGTLGDQDGALPGEYKVVINKWVPSDPNLKIPKFPNTPEGRAQREDYLYRHYGETKSPIKNALPAIYGDLATTPLRCTVSGRTTETFALKSKP